MAKTRVPERDDSAPRSVALPGVGPDPELVLGVVVQVGEDGSALSRRPHPLLFRNQVLPELDVVHRDLETGSVIFN